MEIQRRESQLEKMVLLEFFHQYLLQKFMLLKRKKRQEPSYLWPLRRFHVMDDAKEIWEAIRTRFGGNVNSNKMQKVVLKQQFEAFIISSSEGLEKGYDRFQQLLSQLEAHGAEVSTEDANQTSFSDLCPQLGSLSRNSQVPQNHLQVLKMLLLYHTARATLTRKDMDLLQERPRTGFNDVDIGRDGHKLADSNDCYSNEEVLQEDWKESSN
ncbi:hypothetical protein Tco_0240888 [Tanacetum coccineum]